MAGLLLAKDDDEVENTPSMMLAVCVLGRVLVMGSSFLNVANSYSKQFPHIFI